MAYGFDDKKKKINVMKKDDIYKITGTVSFSSGDSKYTAKRHTITKELYNSGVLIGVEWYEGNDSIYKKLALAGVDESGIYGVEKAASPKANPTKWEIIVYSCNPSLVATKYNYTLYFLR